MATVAVTMMDVEAITTINIERINARCLRTAIKTQFICDTEQSI